MTVLSDLSDDAATAYDDYEAAVTAHGKAVADYEYAYWVHHAAFDTYPSAAARQAAAEEAALDYKVAKVRADAAERRANKRIQVVLAQMVAAQSDLKFAGRQDGGEW